MGLEAISLGELLVEFVRKERDKPHYVVGEYVGPYPSGAPAIFIDTATRLGLRTGFIGVVGNDNFGRMIINRLSSDGVDTTRIRVDPVYPTGLAFVTYFSDGSRRFVFYLKNSASARLSISDIDEEYVSQTRVLHVSGSTLLLNNSVYNACLKAIEIGHRNSIIISFDPNIRIELASRNQILELYNPVIKMTNILLIGLDELLFITRQTNPIDAAKALMSKGPSIIVIKMGSKGSMVIDRKHVIRSDAFKVKEVDPTGAGDVFDAAFIYGYLKNRDLYDTLRFANAAAAIKVTRRGPMEGPVSYDEVVNLIKSSVN